MEIEQYSPEQSMGQRNKKKNFKVSLDKHKWKHNIPKCCKSNLRQKFIAINTGINKKQTSNKQPNFIPQGTRKRINYAQKTERRK